MTVRKFDVVIASDLRLPGGTSSSIVEEIKAQAKAGYSTGLLHVPIYPKPRPFNAKIRRCIEEGLATLIVGTDHVDARLLLIRPPRAFERVPPFASRLTVGMAFVVVNQVPEDESRSVPFYDVPTIAGVVKHSLGIDAVWIPIGPLARSAMEAHRSVVPLADWDWVNIIDLDEWSVPRTRFVSSVPVIGRHSRRDGRKWPESSESILEAYPEDARYRVIILGGAEIPVRILRRVPSNWEVFPFDSMSSKQFLANIDFYVYFHHTGLKEAFGRGILEALSSGSVVIVPDHFQALFGNACIYAEPHGVREIVDRLYADPASYQEQSLRGQAFAREHFGQEVHIRRLKEVIGVPSGVAKTYRISPSRATRRVLLVTSNGGGLGHLMRLMAIARRMSAHIQPLFFTLSTGFSMVCEFGWPVEYMTPLRESGWSRTRWQEIFRLRLQAAIDTHGPNVVVFDGTNPYDGLIETRQSNPDVRFVWSRRGMWKPGMNEDVLGKSEWFDLVVEPGEVAAPFDSGATTRDVRPVTRARPILLLDERELLDSSVAKRQLDLDPDKPAVLVQLRIGGRSTIGEATNRVVTRLATEGVQICVAQASHEVQASHANPGVKFVSAFPMSKYYRAFEFGITSSGYNTYHEAIGFALPTIFVPKVDSDLDDQVARARFAEEAGVGLYANLLDETSLDRSIAVMGDTSERAKMIRRCRELYPGNGAGEAARAIESLFVGSSAELKAILT
jgi:hypothetical protein